MRKKCAKKRTFNNKYTVNQVFAGKRPKSGKRVNVKSVSRVRISVAPQGNIKERDADCRHPLYIFASPYLCVLPLNEL